MTTETTQQAIGSVLAWVIDKTLKIERDYQADGNKDSVGALRSIENEALARIETLCFGNGLDRRSGIGNRRGV